MIRAAIWKPANLHLHRKVDIGGPAHLEHQIATFAWTRAYVAKYRGIAKPHLTIEVRAWYENGDPAHDNLGRTFAPNELVAAKCYAWTLVHDHQASVTEVLSRLQRYGQKTITIEVFGTYELEDP